MSKNPTQVPISVVIPAHNESRFIRKAIETVRAQTLRVAEIIVAADSCSDDTANIAASLGAKVVKVEARNISAARNAGIATATQEWVALLDADDYWKDSKIRRQWEAIQRFPSAGLITCDFYTVIDKKISRRPIKEFRRKRETLQCSVVTFKGGAYFAKVDGKILRRFEIAPQAVLVRRDVFETVGLFDESLDYLQDVEYFARASKDYPLVFIEEPLVYRRLRPDSHSRNSEGKWQSYLAVVERMLQSPDDYAPLAGEEYRDHIKLIFASNERVLAGKRQRLASKASVRSHLQPKRPNQP